MKKENFIKTTKKSMLKAAILAQQEEQLRLSREINEKLVNSLTVKELKKIYEFNEIYLQLVKSSNIKELKSFVKMGLSLIM